MAERDPIAIAGAWQQRPDTKKMNRDGGRRDCLISEGEPGMVRFAVAGLAMLMVAALAAAEEDNGPVLVDLFAGTCARRPALPSEMERIASRLGFVSEGGAVSADMERGPKIDILYMARLTRPGGKVGLTAYFTGPADGPTVSCALTATGVSPDALPSLIETALKVHDRSAKAAPDDNRRVVSWRLGDTGEGDAVEMWARPDLPRRASIQIEYRGRKL